MRGRGSELGIYTFCWRSEDALRDVDFSLAGFWEGAR
jgi:hypothetical protein